MTEGYLVRSYNFVTEKTMTHFYGLELSVAKSIVRHYKKISSTNDIVYYAQEEPTRYW